MMWLRQMAQLSTTMSHAHSATAFHFLISKRRCFLSLPAAVSPHATTPSHSQSAVSTSADVSPSASGESEARGQVEVRL